MFFFQSEPFSPWPDQFGIWTGDFSCMSSLLTRVLAKTLSPTCLPGMATFWPKFPTVWKVAGLGAIRGISVAMARVNSHSGFLTGCCGEA